MIVEPEVIAATEAELVLLEISVNTPPASNFVVVPTMYKTPVADTAKPPDPDMVLAFASEVPLKLTLLNWVPDALISDKVCAAVPLK